MTQAVQEILTRLGHPSPEGRAEVAYAALRFLEPEADGVAEAWDAELARRRPGRERHQETATPRDSMWKGPCSGGRA